MENPSSSLNLTPPSHSPPPSPEKQEPPTNPTSLIHPPPPGNQERQPDKGKAPATTEPMENPSSQLNPIPQNHPPTPTSPENQEPPTNPTSENHPSPPENQERRRDKGKAPATTSTTPHHPHIPITMTTYNPYRTFLIIGTTTTSSVIGGGNVHKAIYNPQNIEELKKLKGHELFVAMKILHQNPQQHHLTLKEVSIKNREINHPNILGIKDELVLDNEFWVTFPYMDQGSLRALMASCFKNGYPEELIAIALKEALKGLHYLHQTGNVHREFDAGHIYFGLEIPAIKIGFLASIYEHNSEYSQPNDSLSESHISIWAAAPENAILSQEYNEKSDVWLVGITAMELAFGGIWVRSRDELEALIDELVGGVKNEEEDEGGDKVEEVQESDTNQTATSKKKPLASFFKKMFKMSSSKSKNKEVEVEESEEGAVPEPSLMKMDRNLSDSFKGMLRECLNDNPQDRPTVDVLLQHDFFRNCKNLFYFQDAVLSAKRETERKKTDERRGI